MPRVARNRRTPTIHVISRGYLCAPHRNTWIMCSVITATMAFEPQKCVARRNHPNGAASFRYTRLSYAWSADGTYTRARQLPVAMRRTNSGRVALPNTYHQLAELRGTRWVSTGPMAAPRPARSSSHPRSRCQVFIARVSHRSRERRQLSPAHAELAVADLVLVLEQPPRRRAGSARAVLVVDAAMTRAHEQPRLREPANRAAEVRAVDREDLELVAALSPHPARDLRGGAVPRYPEGVLVDGQPRLPLGEAGRRAEADPGLATAPPRRGQDVAEHGNADQRGSHHVRQQAAL